MYTYADSTCLQECEELMAKGISGTGQGFDLPGRRLGGFSRQPPLPSLPQAVLAAAESRARRGALVPSGPQRLGGDNNIKAALSPIQAAAMAAERRLHDDIWCGSKSTEGDTHIHENTSVRGPSERQRTSLNSDGTSIQSTMGRETADVGALWQCNTCTLLNQVQFAYAMILCILHKVLSFNCLLY